MNTCATTIAEPAVLLIGQWIRNANDCILALRSTSEPDARLVCDSAITLQRLLRCRSEIRQIYRDIISQLQQRLNDAMVDMEVGAIITETSIESWYNRALGAIARGQADLSPFVQELDDAELLLDFFGINLRCGESDKEVTRLTRVLQQCYRRALRNEERFFAARGMVDALLNTIDADAGEASAIRLTWWKKTLTKGEL